MPGGQTFRAQPDFLTEESCCLSARADTALNSAAGDRLAQRFTAYSLRHPGPGDPVVPFTLHNLEPAERTLLVDQAPAGLLQQAPRLPVWRQPWQPMRPFLFD